ncbi:MAG: ACT domain-containing protein [Elusimicrobiales bacterium]|nr:ACT domain-containing protein [Elusimicrobiales bacterium]
MIKIVKQYSVFLPNIPGALSKFVELFSKEGVNIIGIASEIRDDSGIVRITVDTDRKISYLLTNAGFTTVETQMIMIELPDKPGTLFKLTSMLADNGINITTVYGTTYTGSIGHLLLNVSDANKALELIKGLLEIK